MLCLQAYHHRWDESRIYVKETPESPMDSGWRFFSGTESQEEIDNPENVEIYDVNTIANYDVTIIPYLHTESDTAFERIECKNEFRIVKI